MAEISLKNTIINQSNGLYAQTSLGTAIVNTNVEASLVGAGVGSLTVPANGFRVGDSFTAKMCGKFSSLNNATLEIFIKSNSNVIAAIPVLTLTASTDVVFDLIVDFTVAAVGPLGVASLHANGMFTYNKSSNSNYIGTNFLVIDDTDFDTTIINTLDITAKWGAASVSNSIQSQNFNLFRIF
jgi:hypothetical protein